MYSAWTKLRRFRLETSKYDGRSSTNQRSTFLNVREVVLHAIRQKKRGQAPERNKAIQEEVEKLVDAGIMKEVHYHNWLSNPFMVKKHDGSWRMCVDFKDLNKACPQDGYPLPEIDWKVESLCGYPFKCFQETQYNGSCQLEVYVDELVIKSRTEEEIIRDIAENLQNSLQIHTMKLNLKNAPSRCTKWMFMGYKGNADGLSKYDPLQNLTRVLSFHAPRCPQGLAKAEWET
ncbi:hypothetical protein Tco_0732008 [Tanacetum coccineum]